MLDVKEFKVAKIQIHYLSLATYTAVSLLIYRNWIVALDDLFECYSYSYLVLQKEFVSEPFIFLFKIFYPYNIGELIAIGLGLPPYYGIIITNIAFTTFGAFCMYMFLMKLVWQLRLKNNNINKNFLYCSAFSGGLAYMLLPYSLAGDDWTFGARMLFPLAFYLVLKSLENDKWFILLGALVLWAGSFYVDVRFFLYTFIDSIFLIFIPLLLLRLVGKKILLRKFALFLLSYSTFSLPFLTRYFSVYFNRQLLIPVAPMGQHDLVGIIRGFSPPLFNGLTLGFNPMYKPYVVVAFFLLAFISIGAIVSRKSTYSVFLTYLLAITVAVLGLFFRFPYASMPMIDHFFLFLVDRGIVQPIFVILFQFGRFAYSTITLFISVGIGLAIILLSECLSALSRKIVFLFFIILILVSLPILGNYSNAPGPFIPSSPSLSMDFTKLYPVLGPHYQYYSLVIPSTTPDILTYLSLYHEDSETLYYFYNSYIVYLLNEGEVGKAIDMLNLWGIRYLIIVNNSLPKPGVPLGYQFTEKYLIQNLMSSGAKYVGSFGKLTVYNISRLPHPFVVSPYTIYVLGGLPDYANLLEFLRDNNISQIPLPIFYDSPIAFNNPFLPYNLTLPILVSVTSQLDNIAASFLLRDSIIIVPSNFLVNHSYWAAGFDTDPPQGLFIRYVAYGSPNYNWNYGYLPQFGYVYSRPDFPSEPLIMKTSIPHSGKYVILVNALLSPSFGSFTLEIKDKNLSATTSSMLNSTYFSWLKLGEVNLEAGEVNLRLYAQGRVTLNIIALIPSDKYHLAFSLAKNYLSKSKFIYEIPLEKLSKELTIAFAPQASGEYFISIFPANSAKVLINLPHIGQKLVLNNTAKIYLDSSFNYTISMKVNTPTGVVFISNFDFITYFNGTSVTINHITDDVYKIKANSNLLIISSHHLYPLTEKLTMKSNLFICNIPILDIFNGYLIYSIQEPIILEYKHSYYILGTEKIVPLTILILLIMFICFNLIDKQFKNHARYVQNDA
jgi:hypothetical protein